MRKLLGLLAVAGAMAIAMPAERAEAVTLLNPVNAGAVKFASENLVTEVRHGRGGGGFRGGGFRGGGFRHGGFRGGFHRHHHGFRHFHHRRFYGPRFYAPPLYYAPRYCRWVQTYYGPRRVCRHRPWPYYYY